MRIVFDIDFGSTYSQTHLGIYDFDTNTLEYISKSKLEEKVRKGYQVTDLAMKTVEGLKPQIDIVNTCTYAIPTLQVQEEKREYGKQKQSWLNMTQPIYLKNLKSGLYFNYKNVTFAYQKRKKGNEWGVILPKGMTVDIGIQILYQLVPYLLCGDVFIIRLDEANKKVLDFSTLAQLSNIKRIQLFSNNTLFYDKTAIRIAGLVQNLRFDSLFAGTINYDAANKDDLSIVDLSNLYCNEQTKLDNQNLYSFANEIPRGTLVLFPNIGNYAQKCKETYDNFGSDNLYVKNKTVEWINIGNIPKNSDYITTAKKQVAKYSLMGKKLTDYIFYTTVI